MSATSTDGTVDAGSTGPDAGSSEAAGRPFGIWIRVLLARRGLELGVTALAVTMFAWGLDRNGWGNPYYAAAVRSMSRSWSNFFYGVLDPGGWITVDKPPLAVWLQSLSARTFGYSSWSLLMPSVICGALAVWVLMAAVRRPWGRVAGLVAGVVLALTPIIMAVSRSNNPDITLVLMVVLAAYATQRGIEDGRTRWIVLAGLCCGLGFLTKLLAAGVVMPGLWVAYVIAAPGSWRRRLAQAALGAVVFVVVAVAWVAAIDLRPLADRPWIGGSTDGSARDLVFGYNGFGRVTGASQGPGGGIPGGVGGAGGLGGSGGINGFGGSTGILRLFNRGMGDQVMWLTPMAALSALADVVTAIRRRARDARLGALLLWSLWALVTYLVFAFARGIYHNYYVALLAPALAALIGIGVQQAHEARRLGWSVVVVALLATTAVELVLLDRVDAWAWLSIAVPVVVIVAVLSALGFIVVRRTRVVVVALAVGGAALLVAPAVWSLAGIDYAQGQFPDARPGSVREANIGTGAAGGPRGAGAGSAVPLGPGAASGGAGGLPGGGAPGGFVGGGGGRISAAELIWLQRARRGERWILGVSSANEAASHIIAGYDVVALGGFTGSDAAASVKRVATLVARRELRYLSVGTGGGFTGGSASSGLGAAVAAACTPVAASQWGAMGTSGVYDCLEKANALRATRPSTTPGPGSPRAPGAPGGPGLQGITACFRQHGVAFGSNRRPNFSDPKVRAAVQACLGNAGPPGGTAGAAPAPTPP